MAQFFCSTWQPSFLLPGRDRVKVIWRFSHHVEQVVIDELRSVVAVYAQDRERHRAGDVVEAASTHLRALLRTLRFSVQPVAMSVTVSVQACSPAALPPSWPTRSISTNPGTASSQSAQVRTGIWLLSSEPGLVRERPFSSCFSLLAGQAPVDGGRRHARQQRRGVVVDVQFAAPAQDRHQLGQHRRQPFAAGMPSTAQQKTSAA